MKTTRQRILDYLKGRWGASAAELGRALSLTPANIRHHLRILLGEGVVHVVAERHAGNRGRPTLIYSLSEQAHAHNLDGLASALLDELIFADKAEENLLSLAKVAQRMAGHAVPAQAHLTSRLNACIRRLNALNYQARWEAHAHGPHVILGHCPYAAILSEHPELCRLDALLLESLLNASTAQIAKLTPSSHGGFICVFAVRA